VELGRVAESCRTIIAKPAAGNAVARTDSPIAPSLQSHRHSERRIIKTMIHVGIDAANCFRAF
jgi:hypothetical protein